MSDTGEALAIEEQGRLTEAQLKRFFYAVRGLKRRLYTHVHIPITKDPNGPKILNHRCQVCKHNAVGEAEINHAKNCPLLHVQNLWSELKTQRPDLFDFTEFFPKKDEATEKDLTTIP